jgi:hypothetical protein
MIILALDPGFEQTAWLIYDTIKKQIQFAEMKPNQEIVDSFKANSNAVSYDVVACEYIQSQGMPVGKSVFETCLWIGAFWGTCPIKLERIYRSEEKMHLCGSMRAKDSNIRQALIDKFPATGGGKCKQIGTKKKPGPLYGISGDLWSALAVAVTYAETKL